MFMNVNLTSKYFTVNYVKEKILEMRLTHVRAKYALKNLNDNIKCVCTGVQTAEN